MQNCASLGLTPREAEVLTWIAQGKSNYEIGVILSACTGTICKHVEHILDKLNVENRTAAAVVAITALASAKKERSGPMMRFPFVILSEARSTPPVSTVQQGLRAE